MQFGRYFEDFEVGAVYRHWPGKTVTESDDHLFCLITMNHHPLHINHAGVQARLQGRQSHVHHRAVDKNHARAENGSHQDPAAGPLRTGRRGNARANNRFIARRMEAGRHRPLRCGNRRHFPRINSRNQPKCESGNHESRKIIFHNGDPERPGVEALVPSA